jgi:hypothetical protein
VQRLVFFEKKQHHHHQQLHQQHHFEVLQLAIIFKAALDLIPV